MGRGWYFRGASDNLIDPVLFFPDDRDSKVIAD
jgi:hypothetical protein